MNTTDYTYRTFKEDDAPSIMQLVKDAFSDFLGGDFWYWKYMMNPNFDPSLVVVAEKNGEIVGCNHWLMRNFKISADSEVLVSLGGDIVVSPKHRGKNVGKGLLKFFRNSKDFKEKNILLTYMFANPELSKRLYRPAVGYVFAPNSTTMYTKILNSKMLRENFELINSVIQSRVDLQTQLKGLDITILFRLHGAPKFLVKVSSSQVEYFEDNLGHPDVVIEGEYPVFSSAVEGRTGLGKLTKLVFARKLQIKKGKFKIFKLLKIIKIFKVALRAKDKR